MEDAVNEVTTKGSSCRLDSGTHWEDKLWVVGKVLVPTVYWGSVKKSLSVVCAEVNWFCLLGRLKESNQESAKDLMFRKIEKEADDRPQLLRNPSDRLLSEVSCP